MPSVSEGAFMKLSCVGTAFRDEGWCLTAAPGRHVEQRRRSEPGETAVDVTAVRDVRRGVHHPIDDRHLAVDEARVRLDRQRDALLHDVRLGERRRNGTLPLAIADLPAEDDALAAVFVVGLEDEALAI